MMILWSCAALLTMQLTASAQTLAHRYSFYSEADSATNAVDLVGTNNGTFGGDAVISGNQLQLDGAAWVQLQAGIITNDLAVTVEAWGDYPATGQATWANLFDFGTQDTSGDDSYSISFCVNTSGTGQLDAAISDTDTANVVRQNCYVTPVGVPYVLAGMTGGYVAAVFNPPAGYISIYVNGSLAATLTGITQTITPGVRDLNNWIGKDNWPDPALIANLDEFRVWNGALDGLEIAASYQNGFTNLNTNAGSVTAIQLSAASQVVAGGVEAPAVLAEYSLITNTVNITALASYTSGNSNIITIDSSGNIHGIAAGSTTVTASYGGKSSSPVTVTVIPAVSILAHRYSFNDTGSVVKDSIGTLDGNLMGTAVESGGQVVLDGSVGCYVDLGSNSFPNDGIISGYQSATIDYWATFGALANWNYAWAFGNSSGFGFNYVHNVVRNGNTGHRIDDDAIAAQQTIIDMLGDFANETVHCTTIVNPTTGILAVYTNGVLSGVATNDFQPLSNIATNFIYVGRSLWTAVGPDGTGDPYLAGSIDELRVFNGALTPQQIAEADANGPNNTNITVEALQSIQVSIPRLNLGDAFLGGLIANYGNLSNYNVVGNSLAPLLVYTSSNSNIVYQAADGKLHAVGLGSATITANYGGFTGSQTVVVVYEPVLVNRYSFQDAPGSTNAADSVGGPAWNGILPNGGTFTGTNLQLLATGPQYVQLPSGILKDYPAVTIDTWVEFPDPAPVNCMLFAFGDTDAGGAGYNYIFCAPQGGRIAISGVDPGYDGEQGCGGAGDLSATANLIHLTAVFDPPAGTEYWYTNGVVVSSNVAVTVPMSYIDDVTNFICHSIYTADPHEDLYISEFRIYNGALSAADVAAEQVLGPSTLLYGAAPTLAHRYSFSEPVSSSNTVADSVGTLYATLEGNAVESGGRVLLDGTAHTYIDLSSNSFANNGIITGYNSATIDFWATFGTMGAWCYGWSFGSEPSGNGGADFLYFAVNNGGGHPQLDESSSGIVVATGGNLSDSTVHCTTVIDPSSGIMAIYTNGVLSGSVTGDYFPLSSIATNCIYFGRSLWTVLGPPYTGDPYLPTNSSYQEIRVYDGALTPAQIAMADLSGPNNTNINPGALQSFTLQAPSSVQWLQAIPLKLLANYTSLSNFDILGNSAVLPPGMTLTSSQPDVVAISGTTGSAVGLGTSVITVSYSGLTNSASIMVVRAPTAILTHRYSFNDGTANDSVGTANGTLKGSASISGGQLLVPNKTSVGPALDYLELPYGVITNATGLRTNYNDPTATYNDASVTVESWATFYPNQYTWAELFDFGNTDSGGLGEYDIHVSVHAGDGDTFIGISDSDNANNDYQFEDVPGGSHLDGKTNLYIAAVFNPPAGYLAIYTNGVLMGENSSITIPMAGVWSLLDKIGADVWPDPGMQGSVDEFRIYNGVLSPDQIAADYILGPNALSTPPPTGVSLGASILAGNLVISWPVSGTTGYSLYTSSTIGTNAVWTLVSTTPTVVGQNNQVSVPTSGGGASQFYELKN